MSIEEVKQLIELKKKEGKFLAVTKYKNIIAKKLVEQEDKKDSID